jgi:hypothetical protein
VDKEGTHYLHVRADSKPSRAGRQLRRDNQTELRTSGNETWSNGGLTFGETMAATIIGIRFVRTHFCPKGILILV